MVSNALTFRQGFQDLIHLLSSTKISHHCAESFNIDEWAGLREDQDRVELLRQALHFLAEAVAQGMRDPDSNIKLEALSAAHMVLSVWMQSLRSNACAGAT